eukprot:TRINITY_DN1988_c0_g1_i1.p1 TRINITY_DN1988_c0_g1~~TRINITY_DN1988_c0_g1_i1.p1  ORF type:complete len:708 (+),score=160.52 TRINITY_DN1988_c0_g1_i1:101-2224(+)
MSKDAADRAALGRENAELRADNLRLKSDNLQLMKLQAVSGDVVDELRRLNAIVEMSDNDVRGQRAAFLRRDADYYHANELMYRSQEELDNVRAQLMISQKSLKDIELSNAALRRMVPTLKDQLAKVTEERNQLRTESTQLKAELTTIVSSWEEKYTTLQQTSTREIQRTKQEQLRDMTALNEKLKAERARSDALETDLASLQSDGFTDDGSNPDSPRSGSATPKSGSFVSSKSARRRFMSVVDHDAFRTNHDAELQRTRAKMEEKQTQLEKKHAEAMAQLEATHQQQIIALQQEIAQANDVSENLMTQLQETELDLAATKHDFEEAIAALRVMRAQFDEVSHVHQQEKHSAIERQVIRALVKIWRTNREDIVPLRSDLSDSVLSSSSARSHNSSENYLSLYCDPIMLKWAESKGYSDLVQAIVIMQTVLEGETEQADGKVATTAQGTDLVFESAAVVSETSAIVAEYSAEDESQPQPFQPPPQENCIWLSLPQNLWELVCSQLSLPTLVRLSETCHSLRAATRSDYLWEPFCRQCNYERSTPDMSWYQCFVDCYRFALQLPGVWYWNTPSRDQLQVYSERIGWMVYLAAETSNISDSAPRPLEDISLRARGYGCTAVHCRIAVDGKPAQWLFERCQFSPSHHVCCAKYSGQELLLAQEHGMSDQFCLARDERLVQHMANARRWIIWRGQARVERNQHMLAGFTTAER